MEMRYLAMLQWLAWLPSSSRYWARSSLVISSPRALVITGCCVAEGFELGAILGFLLQQRRKPAG